MGKIHATAALAGLALSALGADAGAEGMEALAAVAPSILSVIPLDGATGVPLNRVISVSFNTPMDCATLTANTFKVRNPAGMAVAGSISCNGYTATFTPANNLGASRIFSASVTSGAKSQLGTSLSAAKQWSFTTGNPGVLDSVPPTVSSVEPASGATGVWAKPTISAIFSERLDCATVSASTFTLRDGAGNPIAGKLGCSGNKVTFVPGNMLRWWANYTATLSGGIRDLARNTLGYTKTWSFRTQAKPLFSSNDASVAEGPALVVSGSENVAYFTVRLSPTVPVPMTVNYETRNGTATGGKICELVGAGVDYVSTAGTLTIPAGKSSGTIAVTICGDNVIEGGDETFSLALSSPSWPAGLAKVLSTGTILNDDAPALNDTMVTSYYDDVGATDYTGALAYPRQDGMVGRDVLNEALSWADGWYGFSFTKLGADGNALAVQDGTYDYYSGTEAAGTSWSCVLDNVTGLTWEVKTFGGGKRDASYTYSREGDPSDLSDTCGLGYSGYCVASSYAGDVNNMALCGHTDWRLPTRAELQSIMTHAQPAKYSPTIDTNFFPTARAATYWSVSDDAAVNTRGWVANFAAYGMDWPQARTMKHKLMLVRGGPTPPATRFVASGDGTVYDAQTGLTWKRCPEGYTFDDQGTADVGDDTCTLSGVALMNWQQALAGSELDRTGGFSDWRVPNTKELQSLVDSNRASPSIDPLFVSTPGVAFWTSTTLASSFDTAEVVMFDYGQTSSKPKNVPIIGAYVRLVR